MSSKLEVFRQMTDTERLLKLDLSGLRVLVVEDELLVARSMGRWLTLAGASAVMARTLEDARRSLLDGRWDLVTLDLDLPDGAGTGLLQLIRSIDPEPAVIVCSGHLNDSAYAQKIQEHGPVYFVPKGFEADDLLRIVLHAARRDARPAQTIPSPASTRPTVPPPRQSFTRLSEEEDPNPAAKRRS